MLYIYCGEDIEASRTNFLNKISLLKKQGAEHEDFSEEELLNKLLQEQTSSLFSNKLLFSCDSCPTNKKDSDLLNKFIVENNIYILLWDGKKEAKTLKKYYPKTNIIESKLPASIFTLIDNLYPKNLINFYKQLNIVLKNSEFNFVRFMITKRLLELIFIKENKELTGYQQWQMWKLKSLANKWDLKILRSMYEALVRFEEQEKKGITPLTFNQALDITLCFYLS